MALASLARSSGERSGTACASIDWTVWVSCAIVKFVIRVVPLHCSKNIASCSKNDIASVEIAEA
jgi:hypothetical protein